MKAGTLALALVILVVEGFFVYRWYDRYYGYDAAPGAAAGEVTAPEKRTGSSANQETVESTGPEDTQDAGDTNSDGNADEQDVGRAQQRDGTAADSAAVEQKEGASQQAEDAAEQEEDSVSRQAEPASQREEAEYVGTVGDIQTKAVETFLKSQDKLLQYDALTDDDVQEMKAIETALQDMAAQAGNLAPPHKYKEQHKVFDAAIDELREAARLAHGLAADPVAASAEHGFDEYDGHVNEASTLLQRSNELLGEDYESIEGVREINPEF